MDQTHARPGRTVDARDDRSAGGALPDAGRRLQLHGAAAASIAALLPGCAGSPQAGGATTIGFADVTGSDAVVDGLRLPKGTVARAVVISGDAVGGTGRASAATVDDAGAAVAQALQFGQLPAGVRYIPLDGASRGLLVVNHGCASGDGGNDGAPPAAASQAANTANAANASAAASPAGHGISVCEIAMKGGSWQLLRPSKLARRLTGTTPMPLAGPAAGHLLMRTAADPAGRSVLGSIGNGGAAATPWGTLLSGEAGWAGCFAAGAGATADQRRYGIGRDTAGGWPQHDQRFDARRHPNEFHRFGWVVEVDPLDAAAPAVKRTALGRAAHGGLCVRLTKDGRAVVYGADAGPSEPVWKFVSAGRMVPAAAGRSAAQANRTLLDSGTLHVARFDADGSGQWLPLLHGQAGLLPARGFADPAEVLIKARQAGDAVGATRLPRAAALAIAADGDVVCALAGDPAGGAAAVSASDAAPPRVDDPAGGVIRWKEAGGDAGAASFRWSRLSFAAGGGAAGVRDGGEAGNGASAARRGGTTIGGGARPAATTDASGLRAAAIGAAGDLTAATDAAVPQAAAIDAVAVRPAAIDAVAARPAAIDPALTTPAFDAAPHAAAFDGRGLLWLAAAAGRQPGGGRQHRLLACDPAGGNVRSLLHGVAGSAIGGIGWASDFRTLFVSVQHAGAAGSPRSAVVAIRRSDGGIIGA